jgi:DnaJ-class molecular chaperone
MRFVAATKARSGMTADPYEALGVARTASQEEIKKAYKRIAREAHPDLNPGDPTAATRFKDAANAYDLLKDPEKRARFDRGEIDASGQERPERGYWRDYAAQDAGAGYHSARGYEDFGDLGDVFGDLFGRRRARSGEGLRMRGPDHHYSLEVGFLEAAKGATRRLTLPDGATLDVRIPEGVADGQTIRLRGKGGPGLGGGDAGDALITVAVAPHPVFRREGDDILVDLPISIDEAVLGAKVEAPTIDGPVSLTIPKGASGDQVLRLRGRGVRRGDQRVRLKIVSPPRIDEELEAFMRGWRERHSYDPRKGGRP